MKKNAKNEMVDFEILNADFEKLSGKAVEKTATNPILKEVHLLNSKSKKLKQASLFENFEKNCQSLEASKTFDAEKMNNFLIDFAILKQTNFKILKNDKNILKESEKRLDFYEILKTAKLTDSLGKLSVILFKIYKRILKKSEQKCSKKELKDAYASAEKLTESKIFKTWSKSPAFKGESDKQIAMQLHKVASELFGNENGVSFFGKKEVYILEQKIGNFKNGKITICNLHNFANAFCDICTKKYVFNFGKNNEKTDENENYIDEINVDVLDEVYKKRKEKAEKKAVKR